MERTSILVDTIPRVADVWLGVGIPAILDHETHLASLSGFRRYLLKSQLQFVGTGWSRPVAPSPIATEPRIGGRQERHPFGGGGRSGQDQDLAGSGQSGGGARLARLAPPTGRTSGHGKDIAETVLPQPRRTLLVFDYLDQMQHLDLGVIRRRLLPDAAARGNTVALLANARPGWVRMPKPGKR